MQDISIREINVNGNVVFAVEGNLYDVNGDYVEVSSSVTDTYFESFQDVLETLASVYFAN